MLLWLAQELYDLLFCTFLVYDNQMTIHYQYVHLKASRVLPTSGLSILIFTFPLELTKKCHLLASLFMRLLSNQINKDFVASSNETINMAMLLNYLYQWQ